MPPLGKYLPHFAPVDTMVIDFGSKNQVVVCETAVLKLHGRPSQDGTKSRLKQGPPNGRQTGHLRTHLDIVK
jgi:hypothetical protein